LKVCLPTDKDDEIVILLHLVGIILNVQISCADIMCTDGYQLIVKKHLFNIANNITKKKLKFHPQNTVEALNF
jgi:hypothetical protein